MGHEVALAGPAGRGKLPQNGYTYHLGSTFRFLTPGDGALINVSPFIASAVRKFLSQREFDVIHLHEPFLPFIGPSFLRWGKGLKIGTFHTWREGPHLAYLCFWPLIKYWNRKLDGRIAVSEWSRKTVGRYFAGDYRIIPNGVNLKRFACETPPPAHLADDRPTILFVGRIESRKGLPHLFNAYKMVKQQEPSLRLVVVGEGGLKEQYQKLTQSLGLEDVLFEGFVSPEALPGYYHRADMFCSSSTVNEAFGITLLEAMAAGTPLIATTINTSTVGEHGKTGLLVEPKDEEALARAIMQLLTDKALAARLGAAAQERAATFDWRNVAEQLLAYYREMGAKG